MACISIERVKEIRKQLRSEFPELKLSVKTIHNSTVSVTIKEGPYDFSKDYIKPNPDNEIEAPMKYIQINEYYIDDQWTGKAKEIFTKIKNIAAKGSYDRNFNDHRANYRDYTFYFSLSVGTWNNYYKVNTK